MRNNFNTHAENFSNGVNASVDPRTGLYSLALPFLSCSANNNLGPMVNFGLTYDPLSVADIGFGKGFTLGLTQYDSHTGTLLLSTGERYHVTETSGQPVILLKKLNNFQFIKTDSSYEIKWKNGVTETLMGPDNVSLTKVPVRITAPSGHSVTLDWNVSGDVPRLNSVKDAYRTLMSLQYYDKISTIISLYPGSNETTSRILTFANGNLVKFTHHSSSAKNAGKTLSLEWAFSYQTVGDLYLINSMTTPTGLKEEVVWQAGIMHFPEKSGLTALPAVVRHTRTPGAGQPPVVTTWSWSDANYLGFGGTSDWDAENDYAFGIAGLYTYSSTQELAGNSATVITKRTYNKFHLLTEEETNRNGAVTLRSITYYAEDLASFGEQPAQFLLPKTTTEVLTDKTGKSGKTRVTLSEFDEQGNPLSTTAPDGTVTTYTWYSPAGEEGCPASPDGFTRYLKKQLVTYVIRNGYEDVPTESTTYTYSLLGDSNFIVQTSQKFISGDILLKTVQNQHEAETGSTEFGRITNITETLFDLSNQESYTSTQAFTTSVSDELITQKTLFTTHDGLTVTTSRSMSALTGVLKEETDAQGVTTSYIYDGYGRLIARTVAKNSHYAHTTTWSYSESGTPSTTETGPDGNKKTTYYDGEGRPVRIKVLDVDNTGDLFEVYSTDYNDIGENVSTKQSDWNTDDEGSTSFSLSQDVEYGVWGESNKATVSYGVSAIGTIDPVTLKRDDQLVGVLKSGIVSSIEQSALDRTHFDEQTLMAVRQESININGEIYCTTDYVHDGRAQVRRVKDPADNVTEFSFDALGRESERLLPDGSRLIHRYAPHLTGNQATEIAITNAEGTSWLLGTREYDGLGRLTKESSGGRISQYHYTGSCPLPSEVVQPDGSVLQYTYIPELGNVVSSLTSDGITQIFSYDPLTGAMLTSQEGEATNKNEWNPSGSLKGETFSRSDSSMTTSYTCLLSDAVMTWTDVNGKTMTYARDKYGRITGISDEALRVKLEYDALGRMCNQTVTDTVTGAALVTQLIFDEFGRETERTISDSNGTVVSERTSWRTNGQVASRETLKNSVTIRKENFSYDARNRLINYIAAGSSLPVDGYGNIITSQIYTFDIVNNLTSVTTVLSDGSSDVAGYHFDNLSDPCQLTSVTHTHADYPQLVKLEYDANGRMTKDEAGRQLNYDILGRLSGVSSNGTADVKYVYDGQDRLISQQISDTETRNLYYRGSELVSELSMTGGENA